MIIEAIGKTLPMSVGIALSPAPVLAVIIILMTARAKTNAPVFLVGWILGILMVGIIVLQLPGIETSGGEPTKLSGLIRIVLGIALLFLALRQWQRRPAPDAPVEVPKILARLDNINVFQALSIGFLLSGLNIKNAALTAAGAATIDYIQGNFGAEVMALFIFAAIASLTIVLPVAIYFIARQKAEAIFGNWRDWLIRNNAKVLIVILLLIGILLISRGWNILIT